uniref:HD domain-containing protein n=1 Tax=Panagrolaimus sp. PS1159 TaxID=55785 RepID=A0AC35EZX1_9BILA
MSDFPPAKKPRLSFESIPKNTQVNINNLDVKCPAAADIVDWDHDYDNFCINLGEGFSSAELPKICKPIMDNPIFGRLRYIRQTGVCFYVFPDTSHTRFTHSLGTAVIAYQLVKKVFKQKINGKPPMTGSEMLCVVIAALCHDLGHGPYSHLCEELFIQEDGTHFTHEQMSTILFDKMLEDYPEIKTKLDKHFTNYHYNLIKDLINPPPFPSKTSDSWNLLVGPEKAFLYAIVNNPVTGLDVDKLEYLFRDSKRSGVMNLTSENIERFIKKIRICSTPDELKYNWLAFPESDAENLRSIFDARKKLHSTVYSHKNVLAINEIYSFSLSEFKDYLDLYIKLIDDYLTTLIKVSPVSTSHPDMIKAREIIEAVEIRQFSKVILSFEGLNQHYPCLEPTAIKTALKDCQLSFDIEDLFITRRDFHGGKGLNVNPLDKVLFYHRYDETTANYIPCAPSAFESSVYIFAPNSCLESDVIEITNTLSEYSYQNAKLLPRRKFRNNENAMPYF